MVFFSLFAYAAQKLAEVVQRRPWSEVLAAWEENPALSPWSGFRTLATARATFPGLVVGVGAGSLITKGRSRMAGAFIRSECDVWLTCDDDVQAESDVLVRLVDAARMTRGIVSAPCVLRGSTGEAKLNLGIAPESALEASELVPLVRTGLGLVAMHRDAILTAAAGVPLATGGIPGEEPFPALFLESLHYPAEGSHYVGEWTGEDFSFSDRARMAGVPIYALTDAAVGHAGVWGMLRKDLAVLVRDPAGRFHSTEPAPPREAGEELRALETNGLTPRRSPATPEG